jgi:hypothetical protein
MKTSPAFLIVAILVALMIVINATIKIILPLVSYAMIRFDHWYMTNPQLDSFYHALRVTME